LESSSQAKDAVISLFWGQSLEGELDGIVLFGNQVVVPQTYVAVNEWGRKKSSDEVEPSLL